jgi:hypothetical protein
MWFQTWLDALHNDSPSRRSPLGKRKAARRGADRRRLFLEGLEDRRVLALAAPVDYDAGASPQAIVSADFNNDNIPDLAVANYSSSNVSVLLGNADGTFQPALSSPTGTNPLSVAVGDFNEDGILDLATVNGDGFAGEVSVLLGNGDNDGNGTGTFAPPASVWSSSSPTSVAVGDFNGDGKLDLGVTAVYYYGWWYGYYSYADVLLGTGTGDFSGPNSTWLDWGYYTASTAANLDGDVSLTGHPIDDFVAVNPDYGTLSVLLGDSSGYLQSASYLSAGSYPWSVAADDVNGDSVIDLVAADRFGSDVSVLLGTGGGGFAQAQSYAVGGEPTSVVIGDFNHDLRTDIATANFASGNLSVLYGRDNDTFSPAVNSASPGAYALVAGDFNGDGWIDAATANVNTNNVSVLLNDKSWPPAPASLAINNVTVTEGNAGTLAAEFTVTRSSEDLSGTVTVNFSTANGGALAGSDYVASSGTLTFGPGESAKTFAIQIIGDLTDEYDQGFYVNLSAASGAVIADGQGVGTILDDDDAPTITITPLVSAKEGANNKTTWFNFLVTLSAASEKEVRVNFETVDGTASTANNDYVYRSGTLIFSPGETSETIAVQVRGDKNKESNERFYVDLSGPWNATLATTRAIGEILDDDAPGGKRNR